ncbi:hypothetical protein MPSEU_000788800 [Mayamaea pseudoterrestris]|nr:hypothetical protein MPSEU_000788800 [Mayamaea pseudoterrestris]
MSLNGISRARLRRKSNLCMHKQVESNSLSVISAVVRLSLLVCLMFLQQSSCCHAFVVQDLLIADVSNQKRVRRKGYRVTSIPYFTFLAAASHGDDFGEPSTRNATSNPSLDSSSSKTVSSSSPDVNLQLLQKRMTQLESLVASQAVRIKRLQDETKMLRDQTETFAQVIQMLRQAGLKTNDNNDNDDKVTNDSHEDAAAAVERTETTKQFLESIDDSEIFGKAPSSVMEAADAAGAAILAGVLAGKKRLLVDVRDAELHADVETLVQFIELAILPVAAGLEGMNTKRNRLKVVFPTVSQLLEYRKRMALSAPEVVALSTLGFDPVEQRDNLVVIIAPSPDDEEGLTAMNELLEPTSIDSQHIDQPLVVLNHHMVPLSGPTAKYEVAYHLRLLSVQFVSGEDVPDEVSEALQPPSLNETSNATTTTEADMYDAAVEAAMEHAKAVGASHGVTRAMVIRAFPQPWHVFVDLSPDTDADFEVAATFDEEPTQDDVNRAIVECLEGSEEEDELVAQQMQQALENGQLDRVTEMLGSMGLDFFDESGSEEDDDDEEGETWDLYGEDSV